MPSQPPPVATTTAELPAAVAAAFDLGPVTGDWQPVGGGRSHPLFRLRTAHGEWAVKRLNRSREDWWWQDHLLAVRIERAALAAGIAMPRPVEPPHPGAGPLVDLTVAEEPEPVSFLAWEWCHGSQVAETDAPPELRRWVGATLARLHALTPAGNAEEGNVYPPHPADAWRRWLDEAGPDTDPAFVRAIADHLPDVALAYRTITEAGDQLPDGLWVFTHRDIKPDNILRTADTPVLLDWEGAGRDLAPWEATRTALAFSRTADGWDRAGFVEVLNAYRAAGGAPVAPVPAAFGGLIDQRLGGAALMLWRALGHRPVSPPERADAHRHALGYLAELRLELAQLDRWAGWLREVA
ncbi:aminoglycoside phosphotransferase family protein [Streptomyces profundus]|uniref:aminoglycoside phosphotransferase family protein n=1 Tax=Streptomyces profundus TaxID=2867410 RepID=UPI001D165EE7|nr:aminoglycoside phosphotransferase family protein [Streptomyces sp. MA3_2.13]UED87300.1 aminoglycoside phosphotransferase family protein [Streptomyces sp. MA3_2.13]